jgi:hypothetical protein
MRLIDPLLGALMAEFEDDHVGLWTVVKQVQRAFPDDQPEAIRTKTLALIWFLLQMGSIEAGSPTKDGRGFQPWHIKPFGVVTRIASEWKDAKPYPRIGEIVWFTTPEVSPRESAISRRHDISQETVR